MGLNFVVPPISTGLMKYWFNDLLIDQIINKHLSVLPLTIF